MKYYLGKESDKFVIRSWPGNKRHPIKEYRLIRDDKDKLEEYIKRLNAPHELRTKVSFQHAFINDALLSEYLTYLINQIPMEKGARSEFSYLKRHVLAFFIHREGLMNPADWFSASDTKWAAYLLTEAPKSKKTRRDIINAANRFVRWLHNRRPNEVPLRLLTPLTRNKLDAEELKRVSAGEAREPKLVPEHEVERICRDAPASIRGAVCLMARYGLRLNEALGVKPGDVKKGSLYIERQQVRLRVYGPPKGKEPRSVPHWGAKAVEAYKWVSEVDGSRMHSRTLYERWTEYVTDYTPHDLRHTFITRMVRKYALRDVSMAVGHKDMRITQKYLKDDRDLDLDPFDPAA